ncbi:SIR2 family protein [Salinibacter ruber]|uniref:SIR2 family protein n=1 Tax=Salinibacter ruber TaxID=146919 RepID=UPI000C9FFA77|nr:SIR2 family protein [Salinibacter ruber]
MRLVPDGPDIPLEILDAQEEGELAIFAGAGVSFPNDLPLFDGLVENVREELGATWKPEEERAKDKDQYDRVLDLLEREHRFPDQVRSAVQGELEAPDKPDLDTHEALVDLARAEYGTGDLHLVTTNFDRLFEKTSRDLDTASAPRLPIPKQKKWNELVYLHGHIGEHDPDGRHLVLTSGDFGIAYLTERWASRFVSELFNHFTVLFVGYGVNDPVMRYLVDAIAADREGGVDERLREAYAFASFEDGERENVKDKWQTKNITPILYPEGQNHERLHDTLHEWAQLWRRGLMSKKNLATTHGVKSPETLTEELSQVRWAMSDPPAARKFAELGEDAPIDWLTVFDESGFTNFAVGEERLEDEIPLSDGGTNTSRPQSLSQVTSSVADWLTAHLDKPDLIHWVLRKGGHLHPEFRQKIQSELKDGGPPQPYRALWQVLAGSEPFVCRPMTYSSLVDRLSPDESPEEWNIGLRADLLGALTPCLQLQPSGSNFPSLSLKGIGDEEEGQIVPSDPSDLARMNLGVHSHFSGLIVDRLEDRDDYEEILREIAFDLSRLLHQAMELFELFGRAGSTEDSIHIQRPSIQAHEQNSDYHEWTVLVDLLRETIHVLSEESPSEVRALTRLFVSQQYPLFRRFAFYSFVTISEPKAQTLLDRIRDSPDPWLWSTSIQVELFRALPELWDALGAEERTLLAEEIAEGPSSKKYQGDISEDERTRLWDRAVWNRLIRIQQQSEEDLTEAASDLLSEIAERREAWEYTGDEKEDFPIWTESGWGYETDYPAESLLDRSDEDVAEILVNHEQHREGLLESWREAVKQDPERALRILELLHEQECYSSGVWKSSFWGFREVEFQSRLHGDVFLLVDQLPVDLLEESIHSLASLLESISQEDLGETEGYMFAIWDRLWPTAVECEVRDGTNPLNTAINHPAGKLAEVLVHLLRGRELTKEGGIEDDLQSRIEVILNEEQEAARLSRVIIASRLALLHFSDPEWTEENVVPLFDWASSDEARFAWSGYLWSPTMRPDLWPAMKPFFLATFDNVDQLRGEAQKSLAVLLAAISVEGKQTLTSDEARDCLRQLDEQGRTEVARWIVRRLEGADERAERLWAERIGPWVESAWPQGAAFRSSATSVSLAWAAIEAGNAFPEAVEVIESRVTALDRPPSVLNRLAESEHPNSHPQASLQLLDALIDDISFHHEAEELQQCLEDISASEADLEDDRRYVRLMDLVEQHL